MKLNSVLVLGALLLTRGLLPAQDASKSISGIVATRLVTPDGKTVAFVLPNPGEPTVPVAAFTFKDAGTLADDYVQLTNVTFTGDKFDPSGTAPVKGVDGSMVTLLVSKSAAGRATPNDATDVFGVVVKNGGEWRLVAARFLPVSRRAAQELAAKDTCLTCHNPDTKVVGPSYRNDPDAAAKIISQIQNGGKDEWGPVPMPPLKTVVPADEMPRLADWILGYRWDAILAE